jgi:hypothetical protein
MDNSYFEQASSILSPAKLHYNLSDEINFADLQKAFVENPSIDVRAWYEK